MNTEPHASTCPQCGAPLPPDAPGGLCPKCLMRMNLADPTMTGGGSAGRSAKPEAPAPEEIAPHFPQLEILALIGRGGMGAVYRARQKDLDRIVALKILPRDIGEAPGFAERFSREARALARLNHPGIVTVYDFGKADRLYFFLMEYVDGLNLRELLQNGRVEPREALAIVPQICDALQYAHDHGIVHRDIKPENILLDRLGNVKVADFGLAKIVGGRDGGPDRPSPAGGPAAADDLTEAGKVMGTPKYMSPEQVQSPGRVDHRADIYALGVVFYQMLTGEMPDRPLQPPSQKVRIDVRLDDVVLRALAHQPELRYQQASILKTEVETILHAGRSDAGQDDRGAQRDGSQAHRRVPDAPPRLSRTALGAAVVLLLSLTVLLALNRGDGPVRLSADAGLAGETHSAGDPGDLPGGIFGPTREQTLIDPTEDRNQAFFDFESGRIRSPGGGLTLEDRTAVWNWATIHDVDAVANTTDPDIRGLLGYGLTAVRVSDDAWAHPPSLAEMNRDIGAQQWNDTRFSGLPERSQSVLSVNTVSTDPDPSRTYMFRTQEGTLGLLQFLGYTDAPGGNVRFRYALAQRDADEAPIASEDDVLVDGGTVAAFMAGGWIELVALSRYPSEGEPWWRPDGTPAGTDLYTTQASGGPSDTFQMVAVVVRLWDLPADASEPRWRLAPRDTWAEGEAVAAGDGGQGRLAMISTKQPRGASIMNMAVGIATAPWETIARARPQAVPPGPQPSRYGSVGLLQPTAVDGGIRVTATHTPRDMQMRLIAVADDGTEHVGLDVEQSISDSIGHTSATFAGLSLSQRDVEIQFQVRPYQWVAFKDISLRPGQRTRVAVSYDETF